MQFYTYKYISGPLENATDGSTDRVGQCIKSSVFDEDSTSPAFEVDGECFPTIFCKAMLCNIINNDIYYSCNTIDI